MDDDKRLLLKSLLNELTRPELEQEYLKVVVKLNEQQIKVNFYDTVASSDDLTEMSAVAKILNFKGMGRNKLFEFLRNHEILRNNNEPYQSYVNMGCFKVIEQTWTNPFGTVKIEYKTMVTQKGLDFIRKLLIEASYEYNSI